MVFHQIGKSDCSDRDGHDCNGSSDYIGLSKFIPADLCPNRDERALDYER